MLQGRKACPLLLFTTFHDLSLLFAVYTHSYMGTMYILIICMFMYIFKKIIYLFIFGCVGSSFLCEGFLQLRQVGATLHRGARASHHRGLSCCGAQAPDAQAQ